MTRNNPGSRNTKRARLNKRRTSPDPSTVEKPRRAASLADNNAIVVEAPPGGRGEDTPPIRM